MINRNYKNKIIDIVHELYSVIFNNGLTKLSMSEDKLILREKSFDLAHYSNLIRKQILDDISLISDNANYGN